MFRCLLSVRCLSEAPLGLAAVVTRLRRSDQDLQGVLEPVVLRVVELMSQPLLGV